MSILTGNGGEASQTSADTVDVCGDRGASEILNRLQGRSVRCYYCGEWFRAAVRAESASCTRCNRQVRVQDLHIKKSHWGSALLSCGRITVHRRADAHVQIVAACHGITVQGALQGHVICGGPVSIARGGLVRGDVLAPTLAVERGGVLEGGLVRVPTSPIGRIALPRG